MLSITKIIVFLELFFSRFEPNQLSLYTRQICRENPYNNYGVMYLFQINLTLKINNTTFKINLT